MDGSLLAEAPSEYGGTILRFTAENFMRLEFVDITPRPVGVIPICGQNGAGKTSLLDCIEWALRGGVALPGVPIREGQLRATTEIQLGQLTIERVAKTSGAPKVRVSANGVEQARPQEILNRIVSEKTVDPLGFDRMPPRDQKAAIIELRGLGPRLAENKAARDKQVAARTAAKTSAATLERQIDALGQIAPDLPADPIPMEAAATAAEAATAQARSNAERRAAFAELERGASALRADADTIGREIAALRKQIEDATRRQVEKLEAAASRDREVEAEREIVAALKEPNSTAFSEELQRITTVNAQIAKRQNRDGLRATLRKTLEEQDAAAAEIERLDAEVTRLLSAEGMPVDGLGFSEDGVLYNGRPLQQACGRERLDVSVSIAMAANPLARVILIRDGSLLDNQAMGRLHEIAIEKGYQIWIERVAATADAGILIEDGRVATVDGKPQEPAGTAQ